MLVLTEILSPITSEQFFKEHFGKQPLLIRSNENKLSSLFSWKDLNRVLNSFPSPHPTLKVRKKGLHKKAAHARDVIESARDGGTLILEDLDRYDEKVSLFCDRLAADISAPTRANLYMSYPGNQGYKIHFDTHDFLILQVEGSKEWFIYPPTVSDPLFFQKSHEIEPPPEIELALRCVVEKGDVLYVPRAWWHYAIATGSPSVHLTIALFLRTGIDLMTWLVDELRDLSIFRATFPPVFQSELPRKLSDPSPYQSRINALRRALCEAMRDPSLGNRYLTYCYARQPIRSPFQFPQQLGLGYESVIATATAFEVMNSCFIRIQDENTVRLTGYGKIIDLPAHTKPILDLLFSRSFWPVSVLKHACQDDWSNMLKVLNILVREGHVRARDENL